MKNNKSSLMLKYQKAKVKLLEYEVPKTEWPKFPLNYKDLAYPTVLSLSQYAEAINDNLDREELFNNLHYCYEFYDAAFQSREQIIHDADFALSGAAAYFFADNFGSSKVLWQEVDLNQVDEGAQECFYELLSLAFTGKTKRNNTYKILKAIELFWKNGNKDELMQDINAHRENVYKTCSPQNWFWGEITCAVTKILIESSARILLPEYSSVDSADWSEYFNRKNSTNLLWASQRLLGEANILKGYNSVIQLPTGAGKTKSIELIIWSMFLAGRGNKALIIAPLRSLCNEITRDMRMAFPLEVTINQFSDVLEDDFMNVLLGITDKQILVCTPEKLQYILHHDISFLSALDVCIFDESHMFDDISRGVMYELLLTEIKLELKSNQQIVLMSAVLPNAEQIVKWLFGNNGRLAYDYNIKSTPKAIGFADNNRQVHYFLSSEEEEDFFVPYTYNVQRLKLIGRERKERFFPETSQDKALYYANVLCKTGGVAIYFPQKRSIPPFFSRIKELSDHGCSFDRIKNYSNQEELSRFRELYKEYYGDDYIYTQIVQYGVLPHYSKLPNGIKISTEYSFKKNKITAIACTSTLSQGVNIPIKYLLITGTNISKAHMSVREFQNLIGRAGRSGVYTEGDIIFTDSTLYDGRLQGRGYYNWNEIKQLFDPTAVEECGSSILNIVRDYQLSYDVILSGKEIVNYLCENIYNDNWLNNLAEELKIDAGEAGNEARAQYHRQQLMAHFSNCKEAIDLIENELVYLLSRKSEEETSELLMEISSELLINTLAYHLANKEEQDLLICLFDAIKSKVETKIGNIKKYSKSMLPIADADQIMEWISLYDINTKKKSIDELIASVEMIFKDVYCSSDLIPGLALSWVSGESFDQISKKYDLTIERTEKICNNTISYQMSFLVGNIIDLVDADCVNLDPLLLLQQMLRYGVNTKTAVSICEKIFNDRFLAREIACLINNYEVSSDKIVAFVREKKDSVMTLVRRYPSFFEDTIVNLI